jgi:hypothetical protein
VAIVELLLLGVARQIGRAVVVIVGHDHGIAGSCQPVGKIAGEIVDAVLMVQQHDAGMRAGRARQDRIGVHGNAIGTQADHVAHGFLPENLL